jgi:phosphoribosyl 1,2-cyclic phosphodiesterase
MTLSLCSFASGSSGNCYLVKSPSGAVIIDAGISAKRILEGLERTETLREDVRAIFVTHEHSDHIKGVRVLSKRLPQAEIYASKGTIAKIQSEISEDRLRVIASGESIKIEDFFVESFHLLHDAREPLGFTVRMGKKRASIVTDTGEITEEIVQAVIDSDILVLEANHDTEILKKGSYPYYLKQRILSSEGHLSNVQAARAIIEMMHENDKKRCILLAHLSRENNNPRIAETEICKILADGGYFTGRDLYIGVLERDTESPLFSI